MTESVTIEKLFYKGISNAVVVSLSSAYISPSRVPLKPDFRVTGKDIIEIHQLDAQPLSLTHDWKLLSQPDESYLFRPTGAGDIPTPTAFVYLYSDANRLSGAYPHHFVFSSFEHMQENAVAMLRLMPKQHINLHQLMCFIKSAKLDRRQVLDQFLDVAYA